MMEGEIVDDYSDRVRNTRMQKGWTQKDLAMRIKEKELLVKKIEKGDLIPEDDVRKKLEQVLGISLLDTSAEDLSTEKGGKVTTTFGDLIKIKKGGK
jgi:putative transcription factor